MSKSSSNKSGSKASALKTQVEEFVRQQKNNTYNYRQVSHAIGASTPAQQRNIALMLVEMAFNGEIIEVSPGKYKSPQRGNEAIGTFIRRSNGKNSVVTDTDGETLLIAVNFSADSCDVAINIPLHALEMLNIPEGKAPVRELLSGESDVKTVSSTEPFTTMIPPYGAVVWKIKHSQVK